MESAVGAHLLNGTAGTDIDVHYWRENGIEVDFVLRSGRRTVAIEVKAGHKQRKHSGLMAIAERFKPTRVLLVGGRGMPLETLLSTPPQQILEG